MQATWSRDVSSARTFLPNSYDATYLMPIALSDYPRLDY